ncbi:MAG: cytochrome c biogenesis protein CcsA [Cyclobacteriaceae bacterium]
MNWKKHWWKILGVLLIYFVLVAGFLADVPRLFILNETIRNLFFHVAIWFAMFVLLIVSVVYAIKYLGKGNPLDDIKSSEFANVGIFFGLLGILTGSVWAKFTWGDWWVNDPKLNATSISMLIYLAYFILRASIENPQAKGRISAVYNIFAFAAAIPLIFILPRLTDSLHPGNGGNPGFNNYDLDNSLRRIFYPSILGYTLLGIWFAGIRIRLQKLKEKLNDLELNK